MAETAEQKRVYLGGFSQAVSEDDIKSRFKPFGEVHSVEIPQPANGAATRGFAYITLAITPPQWHRCISTYSGAKWKGGKLRVEEAKEGYMARLKREKEESRQEECAQPIINKRRHTPVDPDCLVGVLAQDMALVTAKNVDRYNGWSKGRYSRPVLRVSLVKPNGESFTYDPTRYKNSFEKLFGSVRPKHWRDMLWEYDETAASADFEAAKKMPEKTAMPAEASKERQNKRLAKPMAGQGASPGTAAKSVPLESINMESDDDADILDQINMGKAKETQLLVTGQMDMAPFEGAEEIATLVANAAQNVAPELKAKLASGVFDSDSESEASEPTSKRQRLKSEDIGTTISAEDLEAARRERQRTSSILGRLLEDTSLGAEQNIDKHELATNVVAFDSDGVMEDAIDPSDSGSGDGKRSTKSKTNDTKDSESSSSNSSDSGSDSNDTSSGSKSRGGSDKNNEDGSESSDEDSTSRSNSSDSDSDSDSDNDSDGDSDNDSDENEDQEESKEQEESSEMEVDVQEKSTLKSLFGARTNDINDQQADKGGSLFGASSGFKFAEALGLEADEPSAMAAHGMLSTDTLAPVTGGVRLSGPPERNLNANRLPMFFPDVDSPAFGKPEPVFQRQKTEEELEQDLENARGELSREYKTQHRSKVRKSQKMREKHAK